MRDKEFLKSLQANVSESVSYNLESALEFLKDEEVDINKVISKGLKDIENFNKQKSEKKNSSIFFKRVVLAAEIVNRVHQEKTFGHVKLQKLMYLCEEVCNMEISIRYVKKAAGPYDRKFMHSIDNQLERQGWFKVNVVKEARYKAYKYLPMINCNGYKKYFESYYKDNLENINWLINTFKKHPTNKVELVATIYSCLAEFSLDNEEFSEEKLINKVYDWSKEKKKFTEKQIILAYEWMLTNKLIPALS